MFLTLAVYFSQEPLVNLTITGERLENAAPLIAKAVGYADFDRMHPDFKNQVVVIKVKDVPKSEFLAKFKQSLRLEFFRTKAGTELDMSRELRAEEEKIEKEARDAQIKNLFKWINDASEKDKSASPPDYRKLERDLDSVFRTYLEGTEFREKNNISPVAEKISQSLPTTQAALAIASKLPKSIFSDIKESNPRIVFSSHPTPMQKRLNLDWKSASAKGLDEVELWMDVHQRVFSKYLDSDRQATSTSGISDGTIYFTKTIPLSGTAETKLTRAKWYGMPDGPNAKFDRCQVVVSFRRAPNIAVRFLDEDGIEICTRNFPQDLPAIESKSPSGKGGTGHEKVEIQNSNPLFEFPLLYRNIYSQQPKNISLDLTQKLLNVEKNDFLGYCIGRVITADVGNKNLIAPIDDSLLSYSRFIPDAEFPFNRYDDIIERSDRWLVRSYANPKLRRSQQMDRSVLGELFRYTDKGSKKLSIQEKSALMTRAKFTWGILDQFNQEFLWNRNLFRPANFSGESNGFQESHALLIYGLLTDVERRQASTPAGIDVTQLNSRAQTALHKLLFHVGGWGTWMTQHSHASENMLIENPAVSVFRRNGETVVTADMRSHSQASYQELKQQLDVRALFQRRLQETTDIFPNGLTRGLRLMVGHEKSCFVRDKEAAQRGPEEYQSYIDEYSLARIIAFKDEPMGISDWEKSRVDFNNMLVDMKEKLAVGIRLPDTFQTFGWSYQPYHVVETKKLQYKELPSEFRTKIERMARDYNPNFGRPRPLAQ
jgi:hypothetical protein